MIDLLCPSKKLRLNAGSKDSGTISAIRGRDKLFIKYRKKILINKNEYTENYNKKRAYFQERKKKANDSKELWKILKSQLENY